jgi:hypothetical protein
VEGYNKLYDIQLVLTKTEICLCSDRNDNRPRFKPFECAKYDEVFSYIIYFMHDKGFLKLGKASPMTRAFIVCQV